MGLANYKLNSNLRGIIAQRLLRKVCKECSRERTINEDESRMTGIAAGSPVRIATALTGEEKRKRHTEGTLCKACSGSGYRGRIATYEVMPITSNIRNLIGQGKTSREIEDAAINDGMTTLKSNAVELVANQITTISELLKTFEHQISNSNREARI